MSIAYAWVITEDHLEGEDSFDVGITGPSNAPNGLIVDVERGAGHVFELYDDDGELYYTGRIFTPNEDDYGYEEVCFAPLDDFGGPWAGATEVRYPGRPQFAPTGRV